MAVGATYKDVHDYLLFELSRLGHVTAGYLTMEMTPPKIHLWTLLDSRDPGTDELLAKTELNLMKSFPGLEFDFTSIHLAGREPTQFIPDAAVPVIIRDPRVMKYFRQSFRAQVNAGA